MLKKKTTKAATKSSKLPIVRRVDLPKPTVAMKATTATKPVALKAESSAPKAETSRGAVEAPASSSLAPAAQTPPTAPTTVEAKPVVTKTSPPKPIKAEATKPAKADADRPTGSLSCLDAAAEVLKAAKEPMRCRGLVDAMSGKGLWTSHAPTPHQTLASALMREITKKGAASRFRKAGRGQFALNGN